MPKMTVTAALQTAAAMAAAAYSGKSSVGDFSENSEGRVARSFSGDYTVDEVRDLLADLERVQAACDVVRDRLLGAAPRLLNALQNLVAFRDTMGPDMDHDDADAFFTEARTAIARATGRS